MDGKKKTILYCIMYVVVLLAASIPLVCGYLVEGGESLIWIKRIEETAAGIGRGKWIFFPSPEAVAGGGEIHALDSNLWLLIPALIRVLGGSAAAAYIIFMLIINAVTLYAAVRMFGRLFEDRLAVMAGVLLYMTCPYRIWLCYDQGDILRAAAWMLVVLFMWAMAGIFHSDFKWRNKWREVLAASLAFAGIGYADGMILLATAGCAALGALWYRKVRGLLPVLAGGILYLPGAVYMMKYLMKGGMEEWNVPVQSIMANGYTFGQFFSSFAYQEGRPGLGLGLFGALIMLAWLLFVGDVRDVMKKYGFYVTLSLLFLLMSLTAFPWDYVQRVGVVFLRLVSLFGTPGIFFGFASFFLCIPAAYGVVCLRKQDQKFVRTGIPLMIAIASLGVAAYLCNALTESV